MTYSRSNPGNRIAFQRTRAWRQAGHLVYAGVLSVTCVTAGCRVTDGEYVQRGDRVRTAASPGLGFLPNAEGASNLPDIPILAKGTGRRHIILMIGDGMQTAHEVAASRYLYDTDFALAFHAFPDKGYKTTWDLNTYSQRAAEVGAPAYSPEFFEPKIGYDPERGGGAPYPVLEDNDARRSYFSSGGIWPHPDSAATATAMSTGIKTYSAAIAWRPDGGENGALETSPQLLRRYYGMSVGFVTTVPFSHATPAAFFAHSRGRGSVRPIAKEMLTSTRPDVLIGGGFESGYYDAEDLEQAVASNEYVYAHLDEGVDGNDSVLAAAVRANQEGKRLLAIYGGGDDSSFPSPVPVDNPGNPKVERREVGSPTLANASVAALEVLSRDPDGFFLLIEQGDIDWANHNNDFSRMIGCVSDLDSAVRSVVAFVDRSNDSVDWSNTTLIVTADHANSYMRFVKPLHKGDLPAQSGSNYPDGEITYGTTGHTSELVSVYAKGFAAAKIHDYQNVYPDYQILDDTSIYRVTLDAARR